MAIVVVVVLSHVKPPATFTIATLLADMVVLDAIAHAVLEGLVVGTLSYRNLEMK